MKQKVSITVEEEVLKLVEELIQEGRFRNYSHIFEYSLRQFLKVNGGKNE